MSNVRVKYIGTADRFSEVSITGQQQVWHRGEAGFVSDTNAALLVASGQFVVGEVQRANLATDTSGNLTGVVDPKTGNSIPLGSSGADLSVSGNPTPGGVLTAAYAKGSGTIMFTRTPAAGGATVDIGSAVASGATYTVQISDMGYVIGARPVTYLPPAASGSKVQVTPALRPVTDRGALCNTVGSGWTYLQSRTVHIAHDKITAPIVEWTLAMVAGAAENPNASTAYIQSTSIEYPPGVFTQILYGGSKNANIDGNSILSSDPVALPVPIPDGAPFAVWSYVQYTSAKNAYHDDGMLGTIGAAAGEMGTTSTSEMTDYTMGKNTGFAYTGIYATTLRPVCIRDISSKLTAYLMGDSRQRRTIGLDGNIDSKGRKGEAHRAVGARMAMINGAVSSDKYGFVVTAGAYTIRKQLADRCDIIIDEYGINDLGSGATVSVAQFSTWINTMRALLGPTKPYFRQTITPYATSTNYFTDVAGQTPTANAASRSALNDAIRNNTLALTNPMAGYFETADAVETARNSGLIKPLSGRPLTGITVAAQSTTVTSATSQFSAADVGKPFFAPASGNFSAIIVQYVSSTQVKLNTWQYGAIASADTVYVGLSTRDGIHFWPEAEALMAADSSWNQLGAVNY